MRRRPGCARRVEELADYLLFVGEAPLALTVTPRPGLAEYLAARTPHDRKGRSLGQFDLEQRLMRYPCSYMIYSPAFDGLPPAIKQAVYRRMHTILTGDRSRLQIRASLAGEPRGDPGHPARDEAGLRAERVRVSAVPARLPRPR